jgi:hypothetical protein
MRVDFAMVRKAREPAHARIGRGVGDFRTAVMPDALSGAPPRTLCHVRQHRVSRRRPVGIESHWWLVQSWIIEAAGRDPSNLDRLRAICDEVADSKQQSSKERSPHSTSDFRARRGMTIFGAATAGGSSAWSF